MDKAPSVINGLPLFLQTTHTCQNSCGNCGSNSTSGCWRRGWKLSKDAWINLCNRCGLRYKNGKLPPFQEYRDPNEPERPLKVKREPKMGAAAVKSKKRKQIEMLGRGAQPYGESALVDDVYFAFNGRVPADVFMQQQPAGFADSPMLYQEDSVEDSLMPLAGAGLSCFEPPAFYPSLSSGPKFVKYLARCANAGSSYVLFYVIDEHGYATLAVVGADCKYSGHFQYASTPEMCHFAQPLRCSNRRLVLHWLSTLGASVAAQDCEVDLPPLDLAALDRMAASILEDAPSSDLHPFVGWRYCTLDASDGLKHTEYYLVDKANGEQLAATAEHSSDGRALLGKAFAVAVPLFGGTSFASHDDVARWLNYQVERSASSQPAPQRVRRTLVLPDMDDVKAAWGRPHQGSDLVDQDSRSGLLPLSSGGLRQDYASDSSLPASSAAQEPCVSGLHSSILDEEEDGQPISEAFQSQPELLDWVVGVPHEQEVAQFSMWAAQLSAFLDEGPWPAEDVLSMPEVLSILKELSCHCTSLRLLESTGISKPVALLRNHCVLEIAELADQVARAWRDTAAQALSCATSRLQPGAHMQVAQ